MIEIYSKENCIYCAMAKTQFELRNESYTEYKLGVDFDRYQILHMFPSQTTFPFIVLDKVLIGGYTDLMEHYKKEKA